MVDANSNDVIIKLIAAVGGIVVTYITVSAKRNSNKPKAKQPIDEAFDRLEKIANRQQAEIESLKSEIDRLGKEVERLRDENTELKLSRL